MRKRTRKLLSIVLASAMVLSMHSMAFAAEETTTNEVTYTDGVAVIKNATDPVSWNSAQSAQFAAILGHVEDDHLANGKKIEVSANLTSASYNVIPLEGAEGSYLFFGYGSDTMIEVEGEGEIPAAVYDGRKKVFKGGSAAKDAAIDADLALVKYDSSAKTVTKVDGVELTDLKMDKNNLHASVSGSATVPVKEGDVVVGFAHKKLEGKTTPTFTIKAKVSGKGIDKTVKKAVQTALKKASYPYEILTMEVYMDNPSNDPVNDDGKVSENNVKYSTRITTNIDASKLNTKNAKATLSYTVSYTTKKGETKHATKKINPKDYSLKSETVGDDTILILDELKSTDFEYADWGYAGDGYKLCFREKGEKKDKYVAYGIYKSASDVFVTSVE